jgi:hypothetical protein
MLIKLLTFAVIASPFAFKTTRRVFGDWVAGPEGLATIPGLLLHALVYMIIVSFLLARRSNFKSRGKEQDKEAEHLQERNFLSTQ